MKTLEVNGASLIERRHYKSAGKPAALMASPSRTATTSMGRSPPRSPCSEQRLVRRSCFIVATNELDEEVLLDDAEVLRAYKG